MSLPREWSFQAGSAVCMEGENEVGDVNTFDNSQNTFSGSMFSIHSAPVFELNVETNSPKRPSSLVIPVSAINHSSLHISSPDTVDDDDNLLTISSLTAKPLIAKSRELRSIKANKWRRINDDRIAKCSINSPDGGYGWVIVFGAFFVQFWVAGLVKSYGVLFVEIMETYSGSSAAVASWIPAILSALCLALAPLSSALCQKFSCRKVVFIGGVFCALGLTLSYFATNLIHLFFTFGVLTGIGGGLSTTPGIVMVSQYFTKHRALANGICVSGTAAGSFVFPLLIEHLCDSFGFHGTILLLGGCMLHVCVSATLYRPVSIKENCVSVKSKPLPPAISPILDNAQIFLKVPNDQAQIRSNKHLELIFINEALIQTDNKIKKNVLNDLFNQTTVLIDSKESDSEEEKDQIGETIFMKPIRSLRSSSILHSVEDLSTDSTCVYKARQREGISRSMYLMPHVHELTKDVYIQPDTATIPKKKTLSQKIGRYLDLSLLKNVDFIMMCLSVTLMSTGSPYMLYYLPAYVLSTGYTKTEAGYLVAICAALDLCGRLGLGWLSDLQLFDRRKGYIGSIVGAGVAVLVIPVAGSFYVLACSVGMYGLCLGCWFLLVPVLLADQFGTEKISSSYGLVRMFQSIGAISIPPLAGFMRDITGGYEYCFYCMGTCMVLGGVPLLLVPLSFTTETENNTENVKTNSGSNAMSK